MRFKVMLSGNTGLFPGHFRETVLECGFDLAGVADGCFEVSPTDDSLSVIAVEGPEGLGRIGTQAARPFIIFSPGPISADEVQDLKDKGLLGCVTPQTAPEDIAFVLNKALFYDKMMRRNPRAPVNMPVVLTSGTKVINSFASLLSRDGMFVVTLNPLEVNAICALKFSLPDGREFSTGARVLYRVAINKELNIIANPRDPFKRMVSHPGMALFFTDLPADERDLIDKYIETIL